MHPAFLGRASTARLAPSGAKDFVCLSLSWYLCFVCLHGGDLEADSKGKGFYVKPEAMSSLVSLTVECLCLCYIPCVNAPMQVAFIEHGQACMGRRVGAFWSVLCVLVCLVQEWPAGHGRKRARTRGGQQVRLQEDRGRLMESREHVEDRSLCVCVCWWFARPTLQDLRSSLKTIHVMAECIHTSQAKRL